MLIIIALMVPILAVAGLVLTYVAFPHRGEPVPKAPKLGSFMVKTAQSAPVLEERFAEPATFFASLSSRNGQSKDAYVD